MAGTPNSEIHPATKASAQAVAVVKVRGNTSTHLVVQSMIDKTWVWPSELAVRGPTRYSWRWVKQWWETVMGWTLDRCCGLCGNFGTKTLHSFEKNFCPTLDFSRAGNSLIRSLLMCSCAHFAQDKWVTVSKLLRSFRGNEQSWAICSGRSEEMSNLSELLISLMKKWANERLAQKIWLKNLKYCFTVFYSRFFFVKKWANRIFLLPSPFLVRDVSESLILLKSNERCEWMAHFAHQKWATMSDSLRSLRGNERCEWIAHFAHEKWANERFAQKILAKKI